MQTLPGERVEHPGVCTDETDNVSPRLEVHHQKPVRYQEQVGGDQVAPIAQGRRHQRCATADPRDRNVTRSAEPKTS